MASSLFLQALCHQPNLEALWGSFPGIVFPSIVLKGQILIVTITSIVQLHILSRKSISARVESGRSLTGMELKTSQYKFIISDSTFHFANFGAIEISSYVRDRLISVLCWARAEVVRRHARLFKQKGKHISRTKIFPY